MESERPIKSSVFNLETNITAALCYFAPALIAWIPAIGYFAWVIPLAVFIYERNSNFVRFCAAQSFCISIIRLISDVLFDLIIAEARVCAENSTQAFADFWGKTSVPGLGAIIIGAIIGIVLTLVVIYPSYAAYKRRLVVLPLIGKLSEKLSNEFRVKIRRRF